MTVNLGRLQLFRVLNFIRPPPPARLATGFGWIRVAKNGVARAAQINQPWGQAAPGSQPPSRDEEDRSGRQARSAGATPWVSMSAVPTHSLAPFGERCLFRARSTAQTPDSRSPAGALGLSPRSGAPSTTAVLHAQRPSEVRLLPLLP
uniref:Uncharacterized protein n=1 Tax=Rangifer tarandus platyrhynchus TaxID=3082113 RepID=A0ACB0ENW4_RANTA|nr:unnamed protein product [Rangifer tarandus platyrhynchus]